ncbi:GSCFA domain-containing protein [Ferruginibacter yonginensis]|uniref:GSCFA domain-containing protein n=1 Tax=Ferruginibacter yonginensis TaxID=1310416 RepID=A0ABV8QMY8_9BACT
MNFRAAFTPKPFSVKMKHTDKLLLVGSCFTEQIGSKLAAHKFTVLENPNGILFNPISIAQAVSSYCNEKLYKDDELFFYNELWASKKHHTKFSHPDKTVALQQINISQQTAIDYIKKADWLLLTLGSAFVYEFVNVTVTHQYDNVAANCHKIPTNQFNKRLTSAEELTALLNKMIDDVIAINPSIKIIFTVSPVRHLREGFIENNRSKAVLIQTVHNLVDDITVFYFPAYELVIDDLRDYRFFAEDLAHPNYAATNYVWEKFLPAVIDDATVEVMRQVNEINAALLHKPFNPTSTAHQKFLNAYLQKTLQLQAQYPYLNLKEAIQYFSKA